MKRKGKQIQYAVIFISLISLFLSRNCCAGANDKSLRVLFVGNSYTYYNSMPQLFKVMAESKFPGHQIDTKFLGGGGATLKQHWEIGRALEEIRAGKWDFVVLQEQSMLGTAVMESGESYFGSPEPFFTYARLFDRAIRQNGAKTVFYMTWSRKNHTHQQKYLTYAYMTIAEELNSKIAPVGLVWDNLREKNNFDLYQKDGAHPSIHGSFLAAATLIATIFDTPPTGIPGRLEGYEILRGGKLANEKSLLSNLPDADVATLQEAITVVFEQMKGNGGYLKVETAVSEKEPSPLSIIFNQLSTAKGQAFILMIIAVIFLIIKGSIKLFRK